MLSRISRSLTVAASVVTALLATLPAAGQSNATPIAVPGVPSGAADVYPSVINVTDGTTSLSAISVTLSGVNHAFFTDLQAVLVAPSGQAVLLFAGAAGNGDALNATLTFSSSAVTTLPSTNANVVTGVYAPSNFISASFPGPAPAGPYLSSFAPLLGTNPNGQWRLFVSDRFPTVDNGTITGGWSLTLTGTFSVPTSFTYQGVLTSGGSPITGNANVRFTLCSSPTGDLSSSAIAPASIVNFTGIEGGRITAELDFGTALDAALARWLNIEVNTGSGFTTLTPRQLLTPTPQARFAATAGELVPGVPRWLWDSPLNLRAKPDTNASLRWFGGPNPFAGISGLDGALLHGFSGGALGSTNFGERISVLWTSNQHVGIGGVTDPAFSLDVAGRSRVRGTPGESGNSPGLWFASPVSNPVNRTFLGQRDDNNFGVFNGGWRFVVNNNGNTAFSDDAGGTPPERVTVDGSIQLVTGSLTTPHRLTFGPVGNLSGTAENTDPVFFQRVNISTNNTDLRLIIGDDGSLAPGGGGDTFSIHSTAGSTAIIESFRFQSNGVALKAGGGAWGVLSDPRAKHDIAPLSGTLDRLLELRGYSFLYNDDRIATGLAQPGTQIGLMADEVARVFPDWVSTDASGTRYVTERATTALMVEALRDLRAEKDAAVRNAQAQIDALKAEIAKRDAQSASLAARLEALEAAMKATPGKK